MNISHTMDVFEKFITEFIKSDPQKVMEFMEQSKAELAALKEVRKMRLPATINMKDVLHMYPYTLVQGIAREWSLNMGKKKSILIKDITSAMTHNIPDIVDWSSESERAALKYIAEHANLSIIEARRLLNDSLVEVEFMEPGDTEMFDAFVEVYILSGILIAGVRNVEGRDREIVTMASDVKRIVAKHTGWNVAFDQLLTKNSKAVDPSSANDDKKQVGRDKGHNRVMMGMPLKESTLRRPDTSIFKRDSVEIKSGTVISDPFEAMVAYAIAKYKNEFEAERTNCPYHTATIKDKKYVLKQQMTWFLAEWINPATGTTITEEFVKETVTDRKVAKMIMQFTELFFDRFEVLEHHGNDIIAYGTGTRKKYRIVTSAGSSFYPLGSKFEGRIHPYEGKYKTCGIVSRYL